MIAKIGILLVVIFLVLTIFKKFSKQQEKNNSNKPVEMIQDPVCGTYVEEITDYKVKYYDKIYYFCSDKCKQSFIEQKKLENN